MANGRESHPHLELLREQPVTERRRPRGFGSSRDVADPRAHGMALQQRLQAAQTAAVADLGGYDERRLIKIRLEEKVQPGELAGAMDGVELVSQEDDTLVLAFATDEQLQRFEARLASLAAGRAVTYRNVLYALRDLDHWTPADRTGWALERDGFPDEDRFLLDAELWPLWAERQASLERDMFEQWVEERGGRVVDKVAKPYLTIYRVECRRVLGEELLRHRDVRKLDLLPRPGLELGLTLTPVQDLEEVPPPPDQAPGIVVLDSGLASGHPVLASAVGEAVSFVLGAGPDDEHGHGTFVSGIALYDQVEECLQQRRFVPELRLFSGRIFDAQNSGDPKLIENQVEEAVRYFVDEYECRVFNLSYGDKNKPYRGRHVSGLAVTLDALSRELDVLFVVPTGNLSPGDDGAPLDWRTEYPGYLVGPDAVLLDPAPALNVITVGSLAREESGQQQLRWPSDPAYAAVGAMDQPSAFTRCGPSVNAAIKPDLVDYGGNLVVDSRAGSVRNMGVISTSHAFATANPFTLDAGTSFSAPRLAHAAARLVGELPNASVDLCRAMLVAHARPPDSCVSLLSDAATRRQVIGYGLLDRSAVYRSLESCVTLWAEESIEADRHHFYEVPVPPEFWSQGRRNREITVALAYRPAVRTTRVDYRASSISFKFIQADSLDEVARRFDRAVDIATTEAVPERTSGRSIGERDRSGGTVHASTWTFTQPSAQVRQSSWFVVVTRRDSPWGSNLSAQREPYALAVTVSDRSAANTRLYTRIQARLRQRVRARG